MKPLIALEFPQQPEVLALIAQLDAYSDTLSPPEARHRADVTALLQPNVLFAVARSGQGTALGCAGVMLTPDFGEVKRMFVSPAARGQGVGSALLQFLEREAAARGCRRLTLETGHQHHLAYRVYQAHGFQVCGPFGSYQASALNVFMHKAIGTAGDAP